MFLHLSVILSILSTGGGGGGCLPQCMLGYSPPHADTPKGRHPPWADTPAQCMLGYTPPLPSACWDTPPLAQCMLGYTPRPVHSGIHPPPSACWDTHGYCCGRYASYWNAFLLVLKIRQNVFLYRLRTISDYKLLNTEVIPDNRGYTQ